MLRSAGLSGFQSMSKYSEYREAWPFSSTSCHQIESLPTPMWLGTMSSRRPRPWRCNSAGEAGKALVSAELRIEPVVTSEIIPVHASRPGFENGRRVQVADAQLLEVAHDGLRVREREAFVHLHPIGGDRDPGIGVQHALDARPAFRWRLPGAGWLLPVPAQARLRSVEKSGWLRTFSIGCAPSEVEDQQLAHPNSPGRFTNSRPARKMEYSGFTIGVAGEICFPRGLSPGKAPLLKGRIGPSDRETALPYCNEEEPHATFRRSHPNDELHR